MSHPKPGTTAWYVSRGGDASGPFATDMLLAMLRKGELQPLDLVFREGEIEWKPVATFRELKIGPAALLTAETQSEASGSFSSDLSSSPKHSQPAMPASQAPGEKKPAQPARVADPRTLSWIVLRAHGSTFLQEGPFETQTIIDGLEKGNFQFAQYAWHVGMPQWMRIGDLREFDRRSRSRESKPHVPPPLPDPIAAVLLEDDSDIGAEEFHVSMRGLLKVDLTPNPMESMRAMGVTQLGNAAIGGAAAESPEQKASRAVSLVVSGGNLANVPWEQDPSDGYAQSVELIDDEHSGIDLGRDEISMSGFTGGSGRFDPSRTPGPHVIASQQLVPAEMTRELHRESAEARLEKTPHPFVPSTPMVKVRDNWDKWGRHVAGAGMFGLAGVFGWHLLTYKTVSVASARVKAPAAVASAAVPKVATPAPVAAAPVKAPTVAPAPEPVVAKAAAPPQPLAPADFGVVGLKLDKPEGQIVVQGSFAPSIPISVTFKGRLGQILSKISVRKTVAVRRKSGEVPSLRLKDLKLPPGSYTVEVDAAGAKTKNEIFVGKRDAKFLDKLEAHLRDVSLETQTQKKVLFYGAQELNVLARDLGQNYGQLRAKPELWSAYYGRWKARMALVSRSLQELGKKSLDDQAYPEETASLFQAVKSLGEVASQFEQGVGQRRDVASDTLTELISELTRQKDAIGQATARPTADTPDGMM